MQQWQTMSPCHVMPCHVAMHCTRISLIVQMRSHHLYRVVDMVVCFCVCLYAFGVLCASVCVCACYVVVRWYLQPDSPLSIPHTWRVTRPCSSSNNNRCPDIFAAGAVWATSQDRRTLWMPTSIQRKPHINIHTQTRSTATWHQQHRTNTSNTTQRDRAAVSTFVCVFGFVSKSMCGCMRTSGSIAHDHHCDFHCLYMYIICVVTMCVCY